LTIQAGRLLRFKKISECKLAIEQITMVQEERHVRKTEVRDEEDWQSVSYFFITVVSPELKPSLLLQCKSDIIREVRDLSVLVGISTLSDDCREWLPCESS
jgi:hypothetical protein